jgi:eukaryotic-like serine/threonine-protein kinase
MGRSESRRLMSVDRDGAVDALVEATGSFVAPMGFSPDGSMLAVASQNDETPAEIWVVELDTGAKRPMAPEEQVTFGGTWVPGDRIVFTSWKAIDQGRIMVREMRRNAKPAPLFDNWPETLRLEEGRIEFDGTNVVFVASDADKGDPDIWTQPLDGAQEPRPLIATQASEGFPSFSPDGRWVAYESNESGRKEVYLRSHTASDDPDGTVLKVSRTGGSAPLWGAGGHELFFYERSNNRVMVVRLEDGDRLRVSEPRAVIPDIEALNASQLFGTPEFIPMPDGERFAFVQNPETETKIERIEVVLNWAEQLKR